MKNLLTACLPALALFALGGCASTSGLVSSEDDGVYYSSKDRTTAVMRTDSAPVLSNNEEANPDYNGGSNNAPARQQNAGSDQYYDSGYSYMRGVPGYGGTSSYYGPGVSSYSPYSSYTTLSYGGGYGYGGGFCGFSPCGFGGYDPFYSPYGYGYGSGLSISFGFGRPFGYGGFGYSPFGYGYRSYAYRPYGYGGYDPYYYNSPYYGGYYGRGGYYGNSYNNGGYYNNGYSNSGDRGNRRYGSHRDDRSSDGRSSAGRAGSAVGGTTAPVAPNGSGRIRDERVAPNTPQSMPVGVSEATGRTRTDAASAPAGQPMRNNEAYNQPRRLDDRTQPRYRDMDPATNARPASGTISDQDQVTREDGRGRMRDTNQQPQVSGEGQPMAMPQETGRRRGGFFGNNQDSNNDSRAADQPRRSYEQPRQQRTYEQPQQRTYEQPQQRTYEQPQQQRSYSQPSYNGGNNSGNSGSSGSGGNSGGRGRSRGE